MRVTAVLALLATGCMEYQPVAQNPDQVGVPNPRPVEPTIQLDRIVQVQQPQVDVLWVVDNSCSMDEEQKALSTNFPIFMDFFLGSGLDYHIGVVSTDMQDAGQSGRLVSSDGYRYIDSATANPDQVFSRMASLGTSGSGDEKGLDAAWSALELRKEDYNIGFLREESGVHVIVISDERDDSNLVTPAEMASWLNGLRADDDLVTFSSIVSPEPVCSTAYSAGTAYLQVTAAVGGVAWSICSQEWGELLETLGLQASGLRREYFLSELPVDGTIEVRVAENDVIFAFEEELDWIYDRSRNSITFLEYVPNPFAEVLIRYELLETHEE